MRFVLVFIIALCFQTNAQDANRTAQTAGSEFLDKHKQEQNQSITSTLSYTESYVTTSEPFKEKNIANPKETIYDSNKSTTYSLIYIIVFVLAGIALFFITRNQKNLALPQNEIHLEEEDVQTRKKQIWEAMSDPEIIKE